MMPRHHKPGGAPIGKLPGGRALAKGKAPSAPALIAEAARRASRRPVATWLGLPLTVGLAIGGCLVPLLNFPFILIALAPTVGSLPMIAVAVARGDAVPWWAPLLGFRRYERFLGLFWVPYLFAAGASIPLLLALWIDRNFFYGKVGPPLILPALAISVTLLAVLLHRYVLAPFVAADLARDRPLSEVLERAAGLVEGRRLEVFLHLFVIVLFGFSGVLVFGVGVLITAPLAIVAGAGLCLRLEERQVFQGPARLIDRS